MVPRGSVCGAWCQFLVKPINQSGRLLCHGNPSCLLAHLDHPPGPRPATVCAYSKSPDHIDGECPCDFVTV